MTSNDKLRESGIKHHTYYDIHEIININDINIDYYIWWKARNIKPWYNVLNKINELYWG